VRERNAFHKYKAYGQQKDGNGFKDITIPFMFDYLDDAILKENSFMFKGLPFQAESSKLVTQQHTNLEANDRVSIEGSVGLISKVHVIEVQKLGGQRLKNRKKTYVIELET